MPPCSHRLAVSPQCGFASGEAGNLLTPAEQEAKLRLVAQVAQQVWPKVTLGCSAATVESPIAAIRRLDRDLDAVLDDVEIDCTSEVKPFSDGARGRQQMVDSDEIHSHNSPVSL
jgi:hypothetical protein